MSHSKKSIFGVAGGRPRRGLVLSAAAGLGLVLGVVASCDEPEPPPTTCTDWLRCYVDCRDGQYARGDDQAVDREVLLDICENECLDLAGEAEGWSSNMYLAVENPEDVGFFWGRLSVCLNGGD